MKKEITKIVLNKKDVFTTAWNWYKSAKERGLNPLFSECLKIGYEINRERVITKAKNDKRRASAYARKVDKQAKYKVYADKKELLLNEALDLIKTTKEGSDWLDIVETMKDINSGRGICSLSFNVWEKEGFKRLYANISWRLTYGFNKYLDEQEKTLFSGFFDMKTMKVGSVKEGYSLYKKVQEKVFS